MTDPLRVSAAAAERPDAGPAAEGALQHPAPPAPALPAEGHADETQHCRRADRRRGGRRNGQGPEGSAANASTTATVQLPSRVQPFDGNIPYLTRPLQPHGQQTDQPDADGRRAGSVQQHRERHNAAGPVSAVWRVW